MGALTGSGSAAGWRLRARINAIHTTPSTCSRVFVYLKGKAMSDNYTEETFVEGDEQDSLKNLRAAANRAKKLEAELNQMKRQMAFYQAGIPQDDPRMQYFIKGYDGELEAEAIRSAATEAGFLQAAQPQQEAPQVNPVAVAEQRVMAASAGAIAEDNSEAAALAKLESALNEGGLEAMLDVARQYGIPTSYDS